MEAGESAPQALKREILEELGVYVEVGQCLGTFSTPLDKYLIELECYWCRSEQKDFKLTSHGDAGWFSTHELTLLDWAIPDLPAVDLVIKSLSESHRTG